MEKITFTPENLSLLEHVAKEESAARGTPWTVSDAANHITQIGVTRWSALVRYAVKQREAKEARVEKRASKARKPSNDNGKSAPRKVKVRVKKAA